MYFTQVKTFCYSENQIYANRLPCQRGE